ncbi:MAG: hypothetical protein ACLVKO_06940 [Dysgonomonas sp.]
MATQENITYSILLDDKDFRKKYEEIIRNLDTINGKIENLSKSDSEALSKPFDLAGQSIDQMLAQAQLLDAVYGKMYEPLFNIDANNIKSSYQEIQEELSKFGIEIDSLNMKENPFEQLFAKFDLEVVSTAAADGLSKMTETFTKTDAVLLDNLKIADLTVAEWKKVQNQLKDTGKAAEESTDPFIKLGTSFKDLIGKLKGGNLKDITKSFATLFTDIGGATKILGDMNQSLVGVVHEDITDNISKGLELVNGIKDTGLGLAQMFSGQIGPGLVNVTKGIGAIIGKTAKVNKEHREALKQLRLAAEKQQQQYEIAVLTKDLKYEQGTTVFGTDKWGKANNAASNYKKAQDKLQDSVTKLEDVDVVTGSRKSGWGPWRKRKDVWSDLKTAYPELVSVNGEFNKELAQSILSTQKLNDEGKQTLKAAIENADAVEAAYKAMSDYLSGIFGKLGEDMTSAFVNAYKNGTDASQAFYDSASQMMEKMVQDMIYSMAIAPHLQKANEEMMKIMGDESLSEEQKLDQMSGVLGGAIDKIKGEQQFVNSFLEKANQIGNEHNMKLFEKEEAPLPPSDMSKAVARASQDSIDELVGHMAASLEHTSRTSSNTSLMLADTSAMKAELITQTAIIQTISEHTSNIPYMRTSLDSMVTQGVKIKSV